MDLLLQYTIVSISATERRANTSASDHSQTQTEQDIAVTQLGWWAWPQLTNR